MRICLVHNLYGRTARGGAERVVEMISKELVRQGHSVFVISTVGSWGENVRTFLRGGWRMEWEGKVRVYRVATANLAPYSRLASMPAPLRLLWHIFDCFAFETRRSVRRILKEERADLVMTHNLMGLGFLLPRLIRRLGIWHVHTLHDVQLLTPSGLMMVGGRIIFPIAWGLMLYEKCTRWLIGSPDVVVSPSKWLLDEHMNRGFFVASKHVVLLNPTLPPLQKGRDETTNNDFRFLYVGQLEKHKGVDVLLQAFRRADLVESRLDIVGTGSSEKSLRKYAEDLSSVAFHGFQTGASLDALYASANIVVVPSLVHENTPMVITEAYSHGVPVIASRVGGIPEMIEEEKTGWLVPPGDVEALAMAMRNAWEKRNDLSNTKNAIRQSLSGRDVVSYVQRIIVLSETHRHLRVT